MLRNILFQLLLLFTTSLVNVLPGSWTHLTSDDSSSSSSSEEHTCSRLYTQCMRTLPAESPVCGTDGNTYSNICRLHYTRCWLYDGDINITLEKAFDGPCATTQQPTSRPARTQPPTMPPTTTVDPLFEPGIPPRCNFLCPDSRDNVMVCGSDGVTYLSECYLNWLNCRRSKRVTVSYDGPCIIVGTESPSTALPPVVDGGGGNLPGANAPRAATTTAPTTAPPTVTPCSQYCPLVSDPVCGTDGETYISACLLEVQACIDMDQGLKVAYIGVCENNPSPKNQANATQDCPRVETCPLLYLPVCGSDGVTYQSECHLLAKACTDVNHKGLIMVSVGECQSTSPPKDCGMCADVWEPVCGFDNVTYFSECHLRQYACLHDQPYVKVAYRDICKAGFIECPDHCPLGVNDPICGTDDNTYPSICFLSFAACVNKNKKLTVKYRGSCSRDPCYRSCQHKKFQPVCSSTGDTYQNDCFLWVAMCRDNSIIRADSSSPACNMAIP